MRRKIKCSFLLNYWAIILRQLSQVAEVEDGLKVGRTNVKKFAWQIICLLVLQRAHAHIQKTMPDLHKQKHKITTTTATRTRTKARAS